MTRSRYTIAEIDKPHFLTCTIDHLQHLNAERTLQRLRFAKRAHKNDQMRWCRACGMRPCRRRPVIPA